MSSIFRFSHVRPLWFWLPLAVLGIVCPHSSWAQSAWYEGFEQMEVSWKELGGDVRYVVRQHERTPQIRQTGERSEWISLTGEGGTYVYVGHDVGRPRVIDELVCTLQVRSDRPGIQLLAELTL
ncbi:MAG: hypothetical protein ACYC6Y_26435, partial [Thermoguttaceae bacterium]